MYAANAVPDLIQNRGRRAVSGQHFGYLFKRWHGAEEPGEDRVHGGHHIEHGTFGDIGNGPTRGFDSDGGFAEGEEEEEKDLA